MFKTDDKTDITGLSYAELRALLKKTEAAISEKRVEELKVLADGFAKKLQMTGFSIQEGIDAMRPYLPSKAAKPMATGEARPVKFVNPTDATKTWVGMGKPPAWFKEQLAAGRTREDMLVR